jgi:hypothetical protein
MKPKFLTELKMYFDEDRLIELISDDVLKIIENNDKESDESVEDWVERLSNDITHFFD